MTLAAASGERLLTSFGVRAGEASLVRWMTALFAVSQASHGVGANAADALFFLRYGIDDLPLMFVISGPAVMLALVAHSAGLSRQGAKVWLARVMVVAAVWVAGLWAGLFLETTIVYPVIWISTQVLIFLTLTVIWNAAGSACTTRQAKRLFPLFATAAVAGGVVGNLMVGPLANLLGTGNLLLVQGLLLAIAAVLTRRVAGFLGGSPEGHESVRVDMGRAVSAIRSSSLLRLAAAVIFLLFALFYLVVFPFSEVVTAEFSTEADIAGFLGLFSSVATGATFLFSLFATGRLFSRLGLVITLMIVPAVYLMGFTVWLIGFGLVTATIVRGLQWVVVNSLQTTAYSTLFNVLTTARRGSVMALMTAVPAQLGTMSAGGILMMGAGRWSPAQFFVVGAVMSGGAVAVVYVMRSAYVTAVVGAVRRGLVGLWDAPVAGLVNPIDRDVVDVLESHLADPRPRARAIAAAGLGRLANRSSVGRVQELLDDRDPMVRAAAFESICQIEPSAIEPHLAAALSDESALVRLNALHYIDATSRESVDTATLVVVLDDPDPRVRAASAWLAEPEVGRSVVNEMITAGELTSIKAVLDEVARHPGEGLGVEPGTYIESDDAGIRAAAITAFLRSGGEPTRVTPRLEDPSLQVRRISAEGLATSDQGRKLLVGVLHQGSVLASDAALRALTPFEHPEPEFTEWAANEARRAAFLAGHRRVLDPQDSVHGRFLVKVHDSRVDRLIQWVLRAMTTGKTRDVMPIVARGVVSDDEETNAQAIEALESLGDRSVLVVLLPLLEAVGDDASNRSRRESLQQLARDFDPWLSALAARCLERDGYDEVSGVASWDDMSEDHTDTLDEMGRVLVLQRVAMFSELDPEDLLLVARSTREVRFDDGQLIYAEGDHGAELLVIVEGSAVVSRDRDGTTHVIHTYGEGEHVGELSLLTGEPRSADVHSGGAGLLGLVVSKSEFVAVLEERPGVALGMLGTLAGRLIEQTSVSD
jgi:HEAT repeat protein